MRSGLYPLKVISTFFTNLQNPNFDTEKYNGNRTEQRRGEQRRREIAELGAAVEITCMAWDYLALNKDAKRRRYAVHLVTI